MACELQETGEEEEVARCVVLVRVGSRACFPEDRREICKKKDDIEENKRIRWVDV